MASEQGYDARIMPQAPAGLPSASPEQYGAGLGQALEQAGEVVHDSQVREYRIKRQLDAQRQATDFAHRFALQRQNMDGISRQMRANPTSPDYADHEQRIGEALDAARPGMLDGISEGAVRRQAEEQLDSYRTQLLNSEGDFAEAQRVAKTVLDRGQANDLSQNRIRQGVDPDAYAAELKLNREQIYGLPGLTPVQKDKLWKDYENGAGVAFLNHVIDTNPRAAVALVDSGSFNDVLTPEQIEAVRNGAQVELRRVDAQAEHAANVAKGQLNEAIATATEKAGNGIDVSADLPALQAAAQAAGDTSAVEKLKGLARDSAFAKVWNGQTPLARERRISALNAVDPAKRSEDQQAELKWLQDKRGPLDSQYENDTVGFVQTHGQPGEQPPALDPADPASFARRAAWRRGVAGAYGRMDLLSKAERASMADRLGAGDAGYSEVTDTLALFGGAAAKQAAREVAPADKYLQQLVVLPESYRKIARDGRAALQANAKLIPAENSDDADPKVVATSAALDQALQAVPQADRNAIKDVARSIAAKFLHDKGGELTPELWTRSLNMALGAAGPGGKGGLGSWNGQPFLVPDSVTGQQFQDRVFGFMRAHPDNAPVNPDGTPADLRNARPVAVGPNRYQFMVGDRTVMARNKLPWTFTLGEAGR